MQKKDIDFKLRRIVVHSAKNHKTRIINIDLKLTIILFFYCKKLSDTELLFKMNSSSLSIAFSKTIKSSKLKKITFHDMRHIYASFLLSKLRNRANAILIVQQQLRTLNCF